MKAKTHTVYGDNEQQVNDLLEIMGKTATSKGWTFSFWWWRWIYYAKVSAQ